MVDSVVEMVSALVTKGFGFEVVNNLLNYIFGFILERRQLGLTYETI